MTSNPMATGSALLQVAGSEFLRPIGLGLFATLMATTAIAGDLPSGGTVTAGSATIATPGPSQMTINQSTQSAVIDWQNFSIGHDARVDITQPGVASALLNRVHGATTSRIHGQLNANGQVFVVNPNGIFIGPNGQVSTGGFVASTLNITNDDFMAGRYSFAGNGRSALVENAGRIDVVQGGYAALIGGRVNNSGVIRVPLGKVGLAAGERVTLDIAGDGFLQVAVPSQGDETMEALVENSGRIEAEGGQVHLMAASARDAARQVINMSGVIEARSVGGRNGAVVLGGGGGAVRVTGRIETSARSVVQVASSPRPVARPGGDITITGSSIALDGATLDASGAGAGQGGTIRIGGDFKGSGNLQKALTAHVDAATRLISDGGETGNGGRIVVWSDVFTDFSGQVSARGGAQGGDGGFVEISGLADLRYRGLTDTRAPLGETGMLLLDPTNITVPGTVDAATIEANLATSSFTLDTSAPGPDAGNITINDPITWTSGFQFALDADNDITLNAAITGTSGDLTVNAGGTVTTGPGGAIDVGLFEIFGGDWTQLGSTLPAFRAADFRFDPDYTGTFLRALGGDGSAGNPYQLTDIYGVQGIGSGSLHTANFVLANNIDAAITRSWRNFDGPFGFETIDSFSGTLNGARHLIEDLFNVDFSDGGLFGTIETGATVTNLDLVGVDMSIRSGGPLAAVNNGTISNVAVNGNLRTSLGPSGGLVGLNNGTVTDSVAATDVTALTFGGADLAVGGLVGENAGTILRSHSVGPVNASGGDATVYAGGLVGLERGSITASYSLSDVTVTQTSGGDGAVGGLVGCNLGATPCVQPPILPGQLLTITNSFSAGTPSATGGSAIVGGLVGINTGNVVNSFWDTDSSGVSTSAGGTGLTTAQFQDTAGFHALAQPLGWDFANNWAPGAPGMYPRNYTTSPVVFAVPSDFSVQYGQTPTATAPGTVAGGAGVYVFGPLGDTLDTAPVLSNLSFGSQNVGPTTFSPSITSLNSGLGETYEVLSLGANATITPAPLTVTATDQSRVYGDSFSLDPTAFTVSGLVFSDSVDGVTLTSAGEAPFAPVAGSPYAITPSAATGTGLSNYAITYVDGQLTVNPAALTITATDQTRTFGDSFAFTGTEFTASGLVFSADTVDSVTLTSAGAAPFASPFFSPYAITPSAAMGSGLSNYAITYVNGALIVTPGSGPGPQSRIPTPPIPQIPPPPTIDTVFREGGGTAGGGAFGGSGSATGGTAVTPTDKAVLTLGTVETLSEDFEAKAAACGNDNEDISQYLACLADAMETYGDELEVIARDLPPELSGIADIIQGASAGIRAVGQDAQARLAVATTAAERAAIRRDAVRAARAVLRDAQTEIRKAITLIRAEDPELAGLHRQQAETIVAAVGRAEIGLSRVLEL